MTAGSKDSLELIQFLDSQFVLIHTRSCALVSITPVEVLYRNSGTAPATAQSAGEHLIRSAAAVERTFGGITASLWDDPFEWTLPEHLSTNERINEYLAEVEATRRRAFSRFTKDSDLLREVLVPSGTTRPLLVLLIQTLVKATDFQGRAMAILSLISANTVPNFPGNEDVKSNCF